MVYPHVKGFILKHNSGQSQSAVKPKAKVAAKKPSPIAKKAAPVKAAAKPVAQKAAAAQK
jgi:hypothetical protein